VALAEQRGDLLADVIANTPKLPNASGWLTYLRCHDDIGWNVLREETQGGENHAPFDLARVARFYAGDTDDSFARGRSFQSAGGDHVHGTNGMASALAGIADAQARGNADALALAEQRLQLLYGIVFATTGLPALYMGDEIALGNDEAYIGDPLRAAEGRWLHRPAMDWTTADALDARHDTTAARINRSLRRMIAARRATPDLRGDAPMRAFAFADPALLGIGRGDGFIALCNLSAQPVTTTPSTVMLGSRWRDMLAEDDSAVAFPVVLAPYALRWLRRE
jgi:amylosucrase